MNTIQIGNSPKLPIESSEVKFTLFPIEDAEVNEWQLIAKPEVKISGVLLSKELFVDLTRRALLFDIELLHEQLRKTYAATLRREIETKIIIKRAELNKFLVENK